MLIYRLDVNAPPVAPPLPEGQFILADDAESILENFSLWRQNWGWPEALKTAFKVLSHRRIFYGVAEGHKIVQSAWANLGFCRYYPVEREATVLGTVWTSPDKRGRGLATSAMRRTIALLYERGCHRFYVDADASNHASRRMIEKAGFELIA